VSKNYAVRLRCPYGDGESWVILDSRSESLEQILLTPWDFECELHGAQREFPIEATQKDSAVGDEPRPKPPAQARRPRASERQPLHVPVLVRGWREAPGAFHEDVSRIIVNSGDAPVSLAAFREDTSTIVVNSAGALVSLAGKVQVGDLVFLVNKISKEKQEVRVAYVAPEFEGKHSVGLAFDTDSPNFWRCTRQNPRVPATVRVVVRGTDPNPFIQTAYSVDISRTGARLDDVGYLVKPGATVAVERRWHGRARYRVVWVGHIGTEQANQVGLVCLDAEKNIWNLKLPEGEAEDSGKGASPSKKGRAPQR
jgi:PilZ domain-containing protein